MTDALLAWAQHHQTALWVVTVGALASTCCALLGCYLVLRRMSLLGDAISHAILPGIVVAYLVTDQIGSWPVFVGAVLVGVLTAALTESLQGAGNVSEDASMGVVFTSLFALGVFLLKNFAGRVHLDADCALYGLLDFVPFDMVTVAGLNVPRTFLPLCVALLITLMFIGVLWKELKIASFDPALASAMGIRARVVHYLLMGMVALVTVASFEAVGSVLVVAMLIVPGTTAHLLTDRLRTMLLWAALIASLSTIGGYLGAAWLNTNTSGMMTVVAGGLFALALCFAPQQGLLAKYWQRRQLSLRIVGEDLLAMLYRYEELASSGDEWDPMSVREACAAIGGRSLPRIALRRLKKTQQIEIQYDRVTLTDAGRREAQSLVRSHRLWEAYLIKHFHLPLDHVHAPAERIEHFIGPQLQATLADELRDTQHDPHGREIPPAQQSTSEN